MRIIPWYFASKYSTLEDCDEAHDEIKWFSNRALLLVAALLLLVMTLLAVDKFVIDIPGVISAGAYLVGIAIGVYLALSDMIGAVNQRKKELMDEMWDEGH